MYFDNLVEGTHEYIDDFLVRAAYRRHPHVLVADDNMKCEHRRPHRALSPYATVN